MVSQYSPEQSGQGNVGVSGKDDQIPILQM